MALLLFLLGIQLAHATEAINLIGVGEHFPLFRYVREETNDTFVAFTKLKNSCELQNTQSPPFQEWYRLLAPNRGQVLLRQERQKWKNRYPARIDRNNPKVRFTFSLEFSKRLLGNFILNNEAEVFATNLGNTCYTLVTFRRREKPEEVLRLDRILVSGESSGSDPDKVTLLGVNLSTGRPFEYVFSQEE